MTSETNTKQAEQRKTIAELREQLQLARTMGAAVAHHLEETGACDNADDEEGVCAQPTCTYCPLQRTLTAYEQRVGRAPRRAVYRAGEEMLTRGGGKIRMCNDVLVEFCDD